MSASAYLKTKQASTDIYIPAA